MWQFYDPPLECHILIEWPLSSIDQRLRGPDTENSSEDRSAPKRNIFTPLEAARSSSEVVFLSWAHSFEEGWGPVMDQGGYGGAFGGAKAGGAPDPLNFVKRPIVSLRICTLVRFFWKKFWKVCSEDN